MTEGGKRKRNSEKDTRSFRGNKKEFTITNNFSRRKCEKEQWR